MLRLALIFLSVAVIAALFGFGGIALSSVKIVQFIFFVFVTLFTITLIFSAIDRRKPKI